VIKLSTGAEGIDDDDDDEEVVEKSHSMLGFGVKL
jgi:hypothetical protein